jgi:hypothetical protein
MTSAHPLWRTKPGDDGHQAQHRAGPDENWTTLPGSYPTPVEALKAAKAAHDNSEETA